MEINCKYTIRVTELLTELARREKLKGILPEAEVDLFMKVKKKSVTIT